MSVRVSEGVAFHNEAEDLRELCWCLERVLAEKMPVQYEVIREDGESTDKLAKILRQLHSGGKTTRW